MFHLESYRNFRKLSKTSANTDTCIWTGNTFLDIRISSLPMLNEDKSEYRQPTNRFLLHFFLSQRRHAKRCSENNY